MPRRGFPSARHRCSGCGSTRGIPIACVTCRSSPARFAGRRGDGHSASGTERSHARHSPAQPAAGAHCTHTTRTAHAHTRSATGLPFARSLLRSHVNPTRGVPARFGVTGAVGEPGRRGGGGGRRRAWPTLPWARPAPLTAPLSLLAFYACQPKPSHQIYLRNAKGGLFASHCDPRQSTCTRTRPAKEK